MLRKKILVVGSQAAGLTSLVEQMTNWGAEFLFIRTRSVAAELLKSQKFDLVLAKLRLQDASAFELIPLAKGKPLDMYFYLSVQDGLTWLRILKSGSECVGGSAMETPEFLQLAERLIKGERFPERSFAAFGFGST